MSRNRPGTSLSRKAVSDPIAGVLGQRFVLLLTRRHGFGSGMAASLLIPSQDEDDVTRTRETELPR
jgi:hypothetical protein